MWYQLFFWHLAICGIIHVRWAFWNIQTIVQYFQEMIQNVDIVHDIDNVWHITCCSSSCSFFACNAFCSVIYWPLYSLWLLDWDIFSLCTLAIHSSSAALIMDWSWPSPLYAVRLSNRSLYVGAFMWIKNHCLIDVVALNAVLELAMSIANQKISHMICVIPGINVDMSCFAVELIMVDQMSMYLYNTILARVNK